MNFEVSIIILNWNGWKDTVECLESLYQINYQNYNVIIVDNGSDDESIKKIIDYCNGKLKLNSDFFEYTLDNKPINVLEINKEFEITKINYKKFSNLNSNNQLILIKNDKNYGFAEGNNIGIRFALNNFNSNYILLLNNDTVVDKNFLKELVKVTENDDKIGFLGPKIYYYHEKNVIQSVGGKINFNKGVAPSIMKDKIDDGQYEGIYECDYVSGACLLFKKELIEKIGLLDPNYFLYWEETDWCFRSYKKGYKNICVSKSKIWHKYASSGENVTYIYYMTRNTFYFMKKNGTSIQNIIFMLYFIGFKFWFKTFIYLIYHHNIIEFKYFIKGIINGIKLRKEII